MNVRLYFNNSKLSQNIVSESLEQIAKVISPDSGYNMASGDSWPIYDTQNESIIGRVYIEEMAK